MTENGEAILLNRPAEQARRLEDSSDNVYVPTMILNDSNLESTALSAVCNIVRFLRAILLMRL